MLPLALHAPSAKQVSSKIKTTTQVFRAKHVQLDTTASLQVPHPAPISAVSNPPIAKTTSILTWMNVWTVLQVVPASDPSTAQAFIHSLAGGRYLPTSKIQRNQQKYLPNVCSHQHASEQQIHSWHSVTQKP